MKISSTFLVLIVLLVSCATIKSSEKLLQNEGFIEKKSISTQLFSEAQHEYKRRVIMEVAENLIEAKGTTTIPKPNIDIRATRWLVAWSNAKEIGIEEQAYDICSYLQKDSINCIAVLIAHELIHYYDQINKPDQQYHFIKIIKEIIAEALPEDLSVDIEKEKEADYLGGFLAYTAGYQPFNMMENLLPMVYEEYELPDKLKGYPSLSERINMAKVANNKVKNLAKVFEMANHLVAIKKYREAIEFYEYILKEKYQGRDIYNNIGVCYFMMAVEGWKKKVKYVYPIELDGEGRILSGERGDMEDEQAKNYIEKAIQKFEIAYSLDKQFATAKLNIACALSLLENIEEAKNILKEAQFIGSNYKQSKVLVDCQILDGIIAAQMEDIVVAKSKFDAIQQVSILAKYNMDIVEHGKAIYEGESIEEVLPSDNEQIGSKNLDKILNQEIKETRAIPISDNTTLYVKEFDASSLLIAIKQQAQKTTSYSLLKTNPPFKGATLQHIQINSPSKKVLLEYGTPDRILTQKKKEVLIYENAKIIFTLLEGKVSSWAIYRNKNK